jgi:membrane peptidoglycan carboxypeptidase
VNEPPLTLQVVELIHRRRARRQRWQASASQRALRAGAAVLAAASLLAAAVASAAWPLYSYVVRGLPDVAALQTMLDPQTGALLQATRLLDSRGEQVLLELTPPGAERAFVAAGDAPLLSAALIVSADPSFAQHGGALWTHPGLEAHTLAERLAADLLLTQEPEGWRKTLRMRILAADLTARYGRQQVLAWALNSAQFGHWTFGAQSAALFYFGKPAAELSLAEAAILAAAAQAPQVNPLDAPETALQLGHLVLVAMHAQGSISDEQLNAAIAAPLQTAASPALSLSPFAELALVQAQDALGAARLERGGLDLITTQDAALQAQLDAQPSLQAAAVLDALNGRVLALSGQQDAIFPAGTVLQPFVYLDAFANGYAPASLTWNLGAAAGSAPGPLSMRRALALGLPAPAEELLGELGGHHVASVLAAAGLQVDTLQASLSPLDLAAAYATLGTGSYTGQLVEGRLQPAALLFASDANGEIVLDWSVPAYRSVAAAELAFLVTDALSDLSVRSEAERTLLSELGRPAALAPAGDELWQVGYTPQRVVVSAGDAAGWQALFAAAHATLPIRSWQAPGGLSSVVVCVPSGQLPDGECPETRREYFLSGSEPRFADALYERLAVNSLNGRLATVFTPEEFVQQRLFVNVPAHLQPAAEAAGLALPPQDYDAIPALDLSGGAAISTPARFSTVSGTLTVNAQLPPDAAGWDLQIGQGLYPQRWLLLAAGEAGDLPTARWDTSGLSGLWAIQLQVWDADGNVQRAYTVVRVGE